MILGQLLLYISQCNLFFVIEETYFAIYVDDNTPYVTAETLEGRCYKNFRKRFH